MSSMTDVSLAISRPQLSTNLSEGRCTLFGGVGVHEAGVEWRGAHVLQLRARARVRGAARQAADGHPGSHRRASPGAPWPRPGPRRCLAAIAGAAGPADGRRNAHGAAEMGATEDSAAQAERGNRALRRSGGASVGRAVGQLGAVGRLAVCWSAGRPVGRADARLGPCSRCEIAHL